MVTVVGIASLDLTITDQKRLTKKLGDTILNVFPDSMFMMRNLSHDSCTGIAPDEITFFVSVDKDLDIDTKRRIIKDLNDKMVEIVGYKGEKKVICIFRYHDNEGYSENGELFSFL